MHEMHIVKALLEDLFKVAEKENAKKIKKIYIKMGIFTEITPEILNYYIKEHTKGTIAEGVEIDIAPGSSRELRLLSFDCE